MVVPVIGHRWRPVLSVLPVVVLAAATTAVLLAPPTYHYGLLLAAVPLLAATVYSTYTTAVLGALSLVVYVLLHYERTEALDVWLIKVGLVAGFSIVGVMIAQSRAREQRLSRARDVALTLQRELLPQHMPAVPALHTAHRYMPADTAAGVGGDWFDVIPLSGGRVALVIGDVVGHGVHAAALMGRLRTAVQTLADLDSSPSDLLAHMNDLLVRLGEDNPEREPGATLLYLVYDPVIGSCTMSGAGHTPAAFRSPDGKVHFPELPSTPPLGLPGTVFADTEHRLEQGTVIALYTDGLLDLRSTDPDDSLKQLGNALADPQANSLEDMCERIFGSQPDHPRDDDTALLLACTRRFDHTQVATWSLACDPRDAATARTLVTQQLRTWDLEDLIHSTTLIVSELVGNTVRHATAPITLRLVKAATLICEVTDAVSAAPHVRRAGTLDEDGRGLFLISQLASRWGVRHHRDGKTIWVEQHLPTHTSGPHATATS